MFNCVGKLSEFKSVASKKGILKAIRASLSRDKLGDLLVISGIISPDDLRNVLRVQKNKDLPLGQILISQNYITKGQLRQVLFAQYSLRFCTAFFMCFAAVSFFSKKSLADMIGDIPSQIRVISFSDSGLKFDNMVRIPSLFGTDEKQSENLSAFTKWIGVFDRFTMMANDPANEKILEAMRSELSAYQSDSIQDMAEKVNAMMNRQKYIVDQKNWGKSDYWATPIEFMARGGDCEDFAIAKYVGLRALGVPENRLRVAIVHDEKKNIPHAILIVYAENGPIILDNQNKAVLSAKSIKHYRPIYSINRTAWWLHTKPETTIVASAR